MPELANRTKQQVLPAPAVPLVDPVLSMSELFSGAPPGADPFATVCLSLSTLRSTAGRYIRELGYSS